MHCYLQQITMPVTRTAKRAMVRSERKRVFNLRRSRLMREAIKLVKTQPNQKNLSQAFSLIDRATKHKLIHKNKASRMKSSLSTLLS